MARSTYLEIINSVKVLLRESEAASSTEDEYTTLIAKFVTMAKEKVEAAWDWSFQKRIFIVASSDPRFDIIDVVTSAPLTPRGKLVQVYCVTSKSLLSPIPYTTYARLIVESPTSGLPLYYVIDAPLSPTNGARRLRVFPTPSQEIEYYVFVYQPQSSIDDDTYLEVDDQAVVWFAYYLALKERGEDGGISPNDAFALYQNALATQIALDQIHLTDEETTWEVK